MEDLQALRSIFQKVQDSVTSHKLSDRNCIEIINKLTSLGLLEVIYTTDGREYLTPQQLEREIRDEVIVNGGRINLVDLQQIINVDLSHIERKVSELLKHDRTFTLIQGELIDHDYLERAAEEINEALQDAGQISVTDLSKTFNLPAEFLLTVIEPRLGTTIHGQADPLDRGMLFTDSFVARNIAKIRGALSAITRPTPVSSLVSQYGLPEKFFASVLEKLVSSGRLAGTIQGKLDKAVFIPDLYTRTLNTWVSSIFQQNGYIEYDGMQRLGITDGKQFLKRRLKEKESSLVFLQTCCVGKNIQDHIEAAIDEAITTGGWVHTKSLLPSPLTDEDIHQLLQHCMTSSHKSGSQIFCDGIVVNLFVVDQITTVSKSRFKMTRLRVLHHVKKAIRTSPALFAELSKQERASLTESSKADQKQAKKEERQKKATLGGGQKGGAGRGGRETKTRKVKDKGKYKGKGQQDGDDDDDDDEYTDKKSGKDASSMLFSFLPPDEIEEHLTVEINGLADGLSTELAQYLYRPLSQEYKEAAKSLFNKRPGTSSNVANKKSHSEYQEKINGLYANIRLFEKGIKLLDADTQVHLCKHLLRTVCQDVVNLIFEMVATENLLTLADNESFTTENLDDFFDQLETITASEYCDVLLKKVDKKKERQLAFNHRQALLDQLDRETEPAMALHLVVVILFQFQTSCVIHAPGRCVPQIINFLQQYLNPDDFEQLNRYQSLVIKQLSNRSTENKAGEEDKEEDKEADKDQAGAGAVLSENINKIKALVGKPKKVQSE
eukprot:gene17681-9336_t